VMVHPATTESARFTGRPALIIEVLSGNGTTDLVLKTTKYAAAGLPHYWVVDPVQCAVDAFALAPGGFQRAARLGADFPSGAALDFGIARVTIDLAALFR
jgi:hypothetical protein